MRRVAVVVASALLAVGCGGGQDPGLVDVDPPGGSATTSNTLGRCPAGGPDATTPSAGCLDAEGHVLQPSP